MSINLIIGPMFAAKSTELVRRFDMVDKRYQGQGDGIIIRKNDDDRYGKGDLYTHSGIQRPAISGIQDPNDSKMQVLTPLEENFDFSKVDAIFIDEGQFCSDAVRFAERWAKRGKHVHIAGLSGTFERKPWKVISDLIPKADHIMHLVAYNEKQKPSPFSAKIAGSLKIKEIGGKEMYRQATRKQWYEYHKKQRKLLKRFSSFKEASVSTDETTVNILTEDFSSFSTSLSTASDISK